MNRLYRLSLVAILAMSFFVGLSIAQRPMENLGRGVVAVRGTTTAVFISWRLLGLDPAGIGFNLYRSTAGGAPIKINPSVLTGGTNYTDSGADLTQDLSYFVRPVLGGVEQAASGSFTLSANHAIEPLVRINLSPLPGAGYYTKFVWVGDLDGDGEYDFVIDRLAPFDPTNNDIGLGNQYLEAYKRDGTRLWQIDMGPSSRGTYNISPSASTLSMGMYDGATVYDLNGDGKAEVILKIADGVKFPDGSVFSNADVNQQFIAVIDGMTGKLLASKAFPNDFYAVAGKYGTQLGVGYLDGKTPSVLGWLRNRNANKLFNDIVVAWSWNGGEITEQWKWLNPSGVNGTASHQMRIADVDGDGKDEFMTGNFCLNGDGTTRYVLDGVGHGDRFHVGKFDLTRPGLQGYGIQQNNTSLLWEYYYDANTGQIFWKHFGNAVADIGRGLVGDVDASKPGYEAWSVLGLYNGPSGTLAEANTSLQPYPTHSFWWDGDVMTEGLNDSKFEKWDPAHPTTTNSLPRLLTMSTYGAVISDHNPMFFGDILGDWRTEVIAMNSTFTQLMIFTTNIPSTTRLYTMPHNPEYRTCMTTKGYMQSLYLDYYLGDGMSTPPVPNIRYVGVSSGPAVYSGENAVLAGGVLVDTNHLGFRGTGFLNFPLTGGSAQFNSVDGGTGGAKTLSIRYANGAKAVRTGRLLINGVAQAITFPLTADWDTWATLNVTTNLAAGAANTIRFESNGQDLGNIDEITVQ